MKSKIRKVNYRLAVSISVSAGLFSFNALKSPLLHEMLMCSHGIKH